MDSLETIRRELLRLAGSRRHPICINTRRISDLYHVPEKSVRRELTKLAQENAIRMASWDGQGMKPVDAWLDAEEFVESEIGDGHVHVGLWECP